MSSVHDTNTEAPAEALSDALARWKKTVETELKGVPFEKKLVTRTLEGLALQPLYTRADLQGLPDVSAPPGQAPFLRGARPNGYKDRPWQIAQEITAATPQAFNAAIRADLMRSQDAVVVRTADLGITSLEELRTALNGVELTAVPVHLDTGSDLLPQAAFYLALVRELRVPARNLVGSVFADPLGEGIRTGRTLHPFAEVCDSLAAWTKWAEQNAPQLRTIGVNARLWADAGATAVQELAFGLSAAVEYLRELQRRGVSADTAVARLRFEFAVGPQFFMEIAKFRAFRAMLSRVVVAFGADVSAAMGTAVHAATARWNKTLLDPHVNMLRVTTEALSAVLGGCDSLHIAPYDEVAGGTDEFSRRIARNVHTLLAEEFSFLQPADPAGGSWYVEKLTADLAHKAWELFQTIEARGGYAASVRDGTLQQMAAEAAKAKTQAVGSRRLALVGTNLFPNLKETPTAPKTVETAGRSFTPASISPVPMTGTWAERLEAAIGAALAGATASQLSHAGDEGLADPRIPVVAPWRASAGFEQLRAAAVDHMRRTGRRPRVFLAKIGPAAQHKARADFSAGFFAPGGFEVLAKQTFDTPEAAAKAAADSGAEIAVLCSTDDTYPTLVPAFAPAAKSARPGMKLVLAGLPAEPAVVASYRSAGIDEFIHVRASVYDVLSTFLQQIGALA